MSKESAFLYLVGGLEPCEAATTKKYPKQIK